MKYIRHSADDENHIRTLPLLPVLPILKGTNVNFVASTKGKKNIRAGKAPLQIKHSPTLLSPPKIKEVTSMIIIHKE